MKIQHISYLMDIRIHTKNKNACEILSQNHTASFLTDHMDQSNTIEIIAKEIETNGTECVMFLTLQADYLVYEAARQFVNSHPQTDIQMLYAGANKDHGIVQMGRWLYSAEDLNHQATPTHIEATTLNMKTQHPSIFEEIDLLFGEW